MYVYIYISTGDVALFLVQCVWWVFAGALFCLLRVLFKKAAICLRGDLRTHLGSDFFNSLAYQGSYYSYGGLPLCSSSGWGRAALSTAPTSGSYTTGYATTSLGGRRSMRRRGSSSSSISSRMVTSPYAAAIAVPPGLRFPLPRTSTAGAMAGVTRRWPTYYNTLISAAGVPKENEFHVARGTMRRPCIGTFTPPNMRSTTTTTTTGATRNWPIYYNAALPVRRGGGGAATYYATGVVGRAADAQAAAAAATEAVQKPKMAARTILTGGPQRNNTWGMGGLALQFSPTNTSTHNPNIHARTVVTEVESLRDFEEAIQTSRSSFSHPCPPAPGGTFSPSSSSAVGGGGGVHPAIRQGVGTPVAPTGTGAAADTGFYPTLTTIPTVAHPHLPQQQQQQPPSSSGGADSAPHIITYTAPAVPAAVAPAAVAPAAVAPNECQSGALRSTQQPSQTSAAATGKPPVPQGRAPLKVVQFSARWCNPCRRIYPVVKKLSEEISPNEVQFFYVDIDKQPKLAEQYNITSVPTFFFFKDGKPVHSINESSERLLRAAIRKFK